MKPDQLRAVTAADDAANELLATIIVARVVAQNLLFKTQSVDLARDELEVQLERLLTHLQAAERLAQLQASNTGVHGTERRLSSKTLEIAPASFDAKDESGTDDA